MAGFKDLTGQRFGRLTVVERAPNIGRYTAWVCSCECGNVVTIRTDNLRHGHTQSCGCLRRTDLTGKRFGRLIALKPMENLGETTTWLCRCDCGGIAVSRTGGLVVGKIKSCGCLHTTHGMSRADNGEEPRLYRIWRAMRQRCLNEDDAAFPRYGGRGISICPEWADYANFHAWAVVSGYRDDLTIDRIDNDGNYEPGNCRWATYTEQARNVRRNRLVTYRGVTKSLVEWSEILGVEASALRYRLENWTIERAMTESLRGRENATAKA